MTKIRIRCKVCNDYTEYTINDNNYFKWIMTKDVNDLGLSIDDKILFLTKTCNKCRLEKNNRESGYRCT